MWAARMTASGRRLRNGLDADETMWCELECEDHESLSYSFAICFSFCSCKHVYTRYAILVSTRPIFVDPLDQEQVTSPIIASPVSCDFERCGVLLQRPRLQMQAFPWQSLVTWVTCFQLHPSGWWIFRSHPETSQLRMDGRKLGALQASNSMTHKQ